MLPFQHVARGRISSFFLGLVQPFEESPLFLLLLLRRSGKNFRTTTPFRLRYRFIRVDVLKTPLPDFS